MKYRNFTNKLMIIVGVTATAVLTSCEQEFYQDEQYRKEIYIVSGEDNIFQREFSFGGEEIGYLSVYASGTTPIEKEVMVELERNETVLSDYNQKRYGKIEFLSFDNKLDLFLSSERFEEDSIRKLDILDLLNNLNEINRFILIQFYINQESIKNISRNWELQRKP